MKTNDPKTYEEAKEKYEWEQAMQNLWKAKEVTTKYQSQCWMITQDSLGSPKH